MFGGEHNDIVQSYLRTPAHIHFTIGRWIRCYLILYTCEKQVATNTSSYSSDRSGTVTIYSLSFLNRGYALAQLVEALRYKPVRFPIVSLEFFIDIILPAALWP